MAIPLATHAKGLWGMAKAALNMIPIGVAYEAMQTYGNDDLTEEEKAKRLVEGAAFSALGGAGFNAIGQGIRKAIPAIKSRIVKKEEIPSLADESNSIDNNSVKIEENLNTNNANIPDVRTYNLPDIHKQNLENFIKSVNSSHLPENNGEYVFGKTEVINKMQSLYKELENDLIKNPDKKILLKEEK